MLMWGGAACSSGSAACGGAAEAEVLVKRMEPRCFCHCNWLRGVTTQWRAARGDGTRDGVWSKRIKAQQADTGREGTNAN